MPDPFYLTPEWRALRKACLTANPICSCGGKTSHADHLLSRRRRPDLALSLANLVARCHRCHSRVTAAYDGGGGNKVRDGKPAGSVAIGSDAQGWPLRQPGGPRPASAPQTAIRPVYAGRRRVLVSRPKS